MAGYFGATYEQVVQALQGMNTANTLDTDLIGTQEEIETRMMWQKNHILGWTTGDVHAALTQGRFTGHKLIDTARNISQTSVDYGQEFAGTVDQDTYRQQLNEPLSTTDEGDTDYEFTDNVIAISSVTALADTVYADYNVDPETIECPYLAGLLVKMTAMNLGQGTVFGGAGDDGGITDRADQQVVEIYTELNNLKTVMSLSSLLKLNLDQPVGGGNGNYAVISVCG